METEPQETSRRRRRKKVSRETLLEDELKVPEGEPAENEPGAPRKRTRKAPSSIRESAARQHQRSAAALGRSRRAMESEFLANHEPVDRKMLIDADESGSQVAVVEDDVVVEFYMSKQEDASIVSNIYIGVVQNVLPSMEAAFIDIGVGKNAVLYAGEVAWEGIEIDKRNQRFEDKLKVGDKVIVQVTKDAVDLKGPRLTSQITIAGKYLVLVPYGGVSGISKRISEIERKRLKSIVEKFGAPGLIVRTAADGISAEELQNDITTLNQTYKQIYEASLDGKAPQMLYEDAPTDIRVVRDVFNKDFDELIVSGKDTYKLIESYIKESAPQFASKLKKYDGKQPLFAKFNVLDAVKKAMNRKVLLPSGGSIVIDRTEAMTVIDVNTSKFVGQGGTLEQTITQNNLEAAQEIVNQLRLRDVGGIVVIDFVDMLKSANQEKVLTAFIEALAMDRTRHQVSEITSLGLVQMTRKRRGPGLASQMGAICDICEGTGFLQSQIEIIGVKNPVEAKTSLRPSTKNAKIMSAIAASGEETIPADPKPKKRRQTKKTQ